MKSESVFSIIIMDAQGQVVATHFSHNMGLMHEDLEQLFKSSGILVAYDGMVLQL